MRNHPRTLVKHVRDTLRLILIGSSAMAFVACGEGSGQTFDCTEQGVRDAIAAGGGVHTFSCDGPTVVGISDEIVIDRNVVLDGRDELSLDGRGRHRVLHVEEGVAAELRGFGIQRGAADVDSAVTSSGGGILNLGRLTLRGSHLSYNTSTGSGGAIYTTGAPGEVDGSHRLTLIDTVVEFNSAVNGGGVSGYRGSMHVEGGSFVGNRADDQGGAIATRGGPSAAWKFLATIEDVEFKSNNAFEGAAVAVLPVSDVTVERSLIEGNFALETPSEASRGGGIYVYLGQLQFFESTMRGNGASQGGGIFSLDGRVRAEASTFDENSAEVGGAVYNDDGVSDFEAVNSTFWRNGSVSDFSVGGALFNLGTARLVHGTFMRNQSDIASAIMSSGHLDLRNSYIFGDCWSRGTETVLHSYTRNSGACPGTSTVGMAAVYGDLGSNGGPTDTVPLLSGVTVDAVPIEDCEDAMGIPILVDQRGARRPGGDGIGCDVGAFEIQE